MAEDEEERIADRRAESYRKDQEIDRALDSENADKVETLKRRADTKREDYVKANYDESVTEDETERRYGPQ